MLCDVCLFDEREIENVKQLSSRRLQHIIQQCCNPFVEKRYCTPLQKQQHMKHLFKAKMSTKISLTISYTVSKSLVDSLIRVYAYEHDESDFFLLK